MWSEHRFISFDETPVFYRRLAPKETPKAVIMIVHGMGEHGGRYRGLAEHLREMGLECILPDLRGFGRSGGKRGCVKRYQDFHQDLGAIHSFVQKDFKEKPFFFLGHSFGGLISASYAAFCPAARMDGLILSSPIFGIAIPVPWWRHCLGLATSYVWPDYRQDSRVDPRFLTHDPAMLAAYEKDGDIYHRISAGLYRELLSLIARKNEIASEIKKPALVLQAGDDRIVSKKDTIEFYQNLGSSDKQLKIYDDFYHEILNETRRREVFLKIGEWLAAHIS